MATGIKMCGLTRPEDIEAVNALRPEFIGFVFWDRSKRNVTKEQARALKEKLDPSIKAVGVFVDANKDFVLDLCNEGIIDVIQLHGSEDEEYISCLRDHTDKEIIKAFKVRTPEDVAAAKNSSADFILLDNGKGTGENFDWSLLTGVGRDFFLAGGLYDYNVASAIEQTHPYAVDVSSGIEKDGLKDFETMSAFLKAVRESGN